MLPGPVRAVLREVVGIRHAADHVDDVADGGPVLAIGCDVAAGGFAEHVGADIHAHVMQLIAGEHQKALDGLRLRLVIFVAVVDVAVFLVIIRAVREADIVELNFVEAEKADGLLGQLYLVFPHIAAEGARPVAARDIQWVPRCVGNRVFGVVADKE